MKLLQKIKDWARRLKTEIHALWLVHLDPRTPAVVCWLIFAIVIYALSPIDFIPDPIPIIGYLDDLILLPLGIALARRLVPDVIMAECRDQAKNERLEVPARWKRIAAMGVVFVWILLSGVFACFFW